MMSRTIEETVVGGGLIIVMTIVLTELMSNAAQLLTSNLTYVTMRLAIEHGWVFTTPNGLN